MGRKAVSDLLRGCRVSDSCFSIFVAAMNVIAVECDMSLCLIMLSVASKR